MPDKDASELFYLDLYFRNSPALHSTKSTVRFHTRLNSIHLIQDLKSNKKKAPEKKNNLQFSMLHLFQHFSPANPQDFSGIFQSWACQGLQSSNASPFSRPDARQTQLLAWPRQPDQHPVQDCPVLTSSVPRHQQGSWIFSIVIKSFPNLFWFCVLHKQKKNASWQDTMKKAWERTWETVTSYTGICWSIFNWKNKTLLFLISVTSSTSNSN